jgi:hypothetical protein
LSLALMRSSRSHWTSVNIGLPRDVTEGRPTF